MGTRAISYGLLRITFGVMFLFFGIGKFMGGLGNFAGGMNQHFSGKLPSALVLPFSYALPFVEVTVGTLILLGLFTTFALFVSGLLFVVLTFGTVMLGDAPTIAHNVQYALINFVLLWFVEFNAFSLDRLLGRTARMAITAALMLALIFPFSSISSEARTYHSATSSTRYVLDSKEGKFIAHAYAGGLLWFKGHDHYVAARNFAGEASITAGTIIPASLRLVVKAGSLEETGAVFTAAQKQIINKELREIVLEPDKYPDIVFQSSSVTGKSLGNDQYDVRIAGSLTLHGVTHPVTIPARVTLTGNDLRAVGEFTIDRDDYKVKATSAVHGLVTVKDKIKFEFDIVGHRA
ncbi:MAG: YceI family protein [Pyrinomonadaceae bacterium]